jgi:hypothetical protein
MTDRNAHPDSLPQDDNDTRSDIEQAVESRSDDVERLGGGDDESVGSTDGPNGAGGVVPNQDDNAQ